MIKEMFGQLISLEFKNVILLLRFRLLRSLFLTSNIPRSDSIKHKFKESIELRDKGYVILPQLESSMVENLINEYKDTCKRCWGKEYTELLRDLYEGNKARGAFCNLLPSETINNLIKDVLPIVKDTLRLERSKIRIYVSCDTLITPKSESTYKKNALSSYDDALVFHRDFDGLRFLKYFILLTDCDYETGPHYIVKNSSLKGNIDCCGYKRMAKDEIIKYYKVNSIKRFEGPKGFNFLEDTNNFHSGSIPKKGTRILLQFQFLDFKSANYKSFSEPYISLNLLDGGVYNTTGGKTSIFNNKSN